MDYTYGGSLSELFNLDCISLFLRFL